MHINESSVYKSGSKENLNPFCKCKKNRITSTTPTVQMKLASICQYEYLCSTNRAAVT